MDAGWWAGVTGFAFSMAMTPGPNNTLVMASGATHGFVRTLPVSLGIASGVALILAIVSAFGAAFVADPRIAVPLKWLGLAYLVWLAWKIWISVPPDPAEGARSGEAPLSFWQGAALQLVNPKFWALVAGAIVAYGGATPTRSPAELAGLFAIVFGLMTLVSCLTWTLAGVAAGRMISTRRGLTLFNRLMALLLLTSLVPVLVS